MSTQIVCTPDVLGGKPRIDGTRISVEFVVELFSLEYTIEDILEGYQHLTREQIFAALAYAYNQLHEMHIQSWTTL
ncbi:MAG TPA: DUF433 domain-containing protein [Ktedonobacteraceae bacterium]|nr:DUF433 domain-containing protein [Ktedonobacteraceae bacterium]